MRACSPADRWHFGPEHDELRTLHHIAGGAFFTIGEPFKAGALLQTP